MNINKENEKFFLELVDGEILTVTYDGRVRNNRSGNWLGKKPNRVGYHAIGFKDNGKVRSQLIHRLVFLVYGGVFTDEMSIVNHIDGNKSNNCFDNLEACTYSHNSKHAKVLGLHVMSKAARNKLSDLFSGERAPQAKLTNEQAKEIRFLYGNSEVSYRKLAGIYGVSHDTIGAILRKETFKN